MKALRVAAAACVLCIQGTLSLAEAPKNDWLEGGNGPLPPGTTEKITPITSSVSDIRRVVSPISERKSGIASRAGQLRDAIRNLLEHNGRLTGHASDIELDESGLYYRLTMQSEVLFDFDRSDIRRDALPILEQIAQFARDASLRSMVIRGHTDSKGSDAYNIHLSEMRALSVQKWLSGSGRTAGIRLTVEGKGESEPRVSNTRPDGSDDPDGRAKNRRVEFLFPKS